MNTIDQIPLNSDSSLTVGPEDIKSQHMTAQTKTDVPFLNNKLFHNFPVAALIAGALVASGLYHLVLLRLTGGEWSGPFSLRKPGLFGVSAGVTVWSIAWVLTQLFPRRYDRLLANLMSIGLLLEVGLITIQQWRGVPSHFNRSTPFDAAVELTMLGLIMFVTLGIACLCIRSRRLLPMPESRAIAIRSGLWLLLFSCGLGFLITIAGQINLAAGLPPETWGKSGVLKYPHGAALHAIQTLPLLSLIFERLRLSYSASMLKLAVAAQILFLVHALWQTLLGRARLDVDLTGMVVLAVTGLMIAVIGRK
jgi:hypothetical protein